MSAPDDIRPGALGHDRPCPFCEHSAHWSKCGDDIADGVTCPCRCPTPGLD